MQNPTPALFLQISVYKPDLVCCQSVTIICIPSGYSVVCGPCRQSTPEFSPEQLSTLPMPEPLLVMIRRTFSSKCRAQSDMLSCWKDLMQCTHHSFPVIAAKQLDPSAGFLQKFSWLNHFFG